VADWAGVITALSIAVGVLAAALAYFVSRYRDALRQVDMLRQSLTQEKTAHYVTWARLGRREQRLGAMRRQLDGLAEIAQSSAQLALLYESMSAEVKWRESEPAPLD
jgi:hypothetical protein